MAVVVGVMIPLRASGATAVPVISTYAGGPGEGPAKSLGQTPEAVVVHDGPGGLLVYVADVTANVVRVVDVATGNETIAAGALTGSSEVDGGSATAAKLSAPWGIAVDAAGNLFIAEASGARVRRVDAVSKVITTVAGTGVVGNSGDGGPATSAQLTEPRSVAVDASGNLFIGDLATGRVRRVDAASRVITTVAGGGSPPASDTTQGDNGPATNARISELLGVAFDRAGNLLIAAGGRVRRVDAVTQVITTVAGSVQQGFRGDGGPATSAELSGAWAVAVDADGNMFIADSGNQRVRRVDAVTQVITTVAGGAIFPNPRDVGDGFRANQANLSSPKGVGLDSVGNLFIGDSGNYRVRRVDVGSQVITTMAGTGMPARDSGDGGPATSAQLQSNDLAVDAAGNVFIADTLSHRVRRIDAVTKVITTVAGTGFSAFFGDGGQATLANLFEPTGVAVDKDGNLFIADSGNGRIRRVDKESGVITSVASLTRPTDVVVDPVGNLFIVTQHQIRRVDATTKVATTVAGNSTLNGGFGGDGGPAAAALLNGPTAVEVDGAGNLFIADFGNHRVRRVDVDDTIITTVAGNGTAGFSGDGGPATTASLNGPRGLHVSPSGILISDMLNYRVRQVDANQNITTVAGTGTEGFTGDGGPATSARLGRPTDVEVDSAGSLFIATGEFSPLVFGRVRKVALPAPVAALRQLADFDGNGLTDVSVFRPSGGVWFVEGGPTTYWGAQGDIAVPAHYDAVPGADIAVFRPSTGVWYVQGRPTTYWGASGDIPVPGDYNGDGTAEIAVFRPSTGVWYVNGGPTTYWGASGDIPVPGQYDADPATDIAVFRPSTGAWYVDGGPTTFWGAAGDMPVPGDYDGNGTDEIAVFRPSTGVWYVDGGPTTYWGADGDIPVPGQYDADPATDMTVFRPSTGVWYVEGGRTVYWGANGDVPAPLAPALQ